MLLRHEFFTLCCFYQSLSLFPVSNFVKRITLPLPFCTFPALLHFCACCHRYQVLLYTHPTTLTFFFTAESTATLALGKWRKQWTALLPSNILSIIRAFFGQRWLNPLEKSREALDKSKTRNQKILVRISLLFDCFVAQKNCACLQLEWTHSLYERTSVTVGASEAISFPEPTYLLVSTKTRSSGIINFQRPRF